MFSPLVHMYYNDILNIVHQSQKKYSKTFFNFQLMDVSYIKVPLWSLTVADEFHLSQHQKMENRKHLQPRVCKCMRWRPQTESKIGSAAQTDNSNYCLMMMVTAPLACSIKSYFYFTLWRHRIPKNCSAPAQGFSSLH